MKSPYLKDNRLPDIVGALQVMGIYPWGGRKGEDWAKSLGKPLSATEWPSLFAQHPEFFRITSSGWVSLRWRHAYFRTFDPQLGRELTPVELSALAPPQKDDLTFRPLTSDQVEALMKTAIEFHTHAITHEQERRWLSPLLFSLLGAVLAFAGAIIGAYLKS
jgi:hypothetical protein